MQVNTMYKDVHLETEQKKTIAVLVGYSWFKFGTVTLYRIQAMVLTKYMTQ